MTQQKVLIQQEDFAFGDDKVERDFCIPENYKAYEGLKAYNFLNRKDNDITPVFTTLKDLNELSLVRDILKEECILAVGTVEFVQKAFEILGCEVEDIDYPESLQKYLMRDIEVMKYDEMMEKYEGWEKFVKPVKNKKFTGLPLTLKKDNAEIFIGRQIDKESDDLYVTDVLGYIRSEWRVYVRNGEIKSINPYGGFDYDDQHSYDFKLDVGKVHDMIMDLKDQPIAYTLDVAVTCTYDPMDEYFESDTVLIEVNDMWAIGDYGIDEYEYFMGLLARWKEIMRNNNVVTNDSVSN